MRQLLPQTGDRSVQAEWNLSERRRHNNRPWVIMCMISSVDGAIALEGTAGPLGGPTDRELFLHLHRSADAVLVGAATVRAESYHPVAAGQSLFIFSRSGNLGEHHEQLIASPSTRVVSGSVAEVVSTIPGNVCLLEGGAVLNGQMLSADLVDEVSLTIAPRLVASQASRIVVGLDVPSNKWELASVCEADGGFLFMRYLRTR